MKAKLVMMAGCLSVLMSVYAYAGCGEGGCGYSESGSCGGSEYDNVCQCTDPVCSNVADRGCLSKSDCCEAFGNMGAR